MDPRNPHAVAGLAELYLARRDAARARQYAEQAVGLRRNRAVYRVLLGDALALAGDAEGARREWRRALDIEPHNRAARERLQTE